MKSPLISVIVPIYNVESYLNKCVESIVNQTYTNLEIILVDDGSPDNCPIMCDEWAKKDNRIKVIHKENGGLSSARNAGLDIAKGAFIAFVDSDDYVEAHYIEILLKKLLQYNVDLVCCSINNIYENKMENFKLKPVDKDLVISGSSILPEFYRHYTTALMVAWNKLYKRELFDNLRYTAGRIYEDGAIVLHLLSKCKQVAIIPDVLYNYLRRENSIMGTGISLAKAKSMDANFNEHMEFLIANDYKSCLKYEAKSLKDYGIMFKTAQSEDIKKYLHENFKKAWKKYRKYVKPLNKSSLSIYKHCFPLILKGLKK